MESLAGHLNPQQTMHYTHPDEDVKKAAIDVLNYSGNPDEDKIFLHPDVKKLMDVFEQQKQEFLSKMEDTISRLVNSGEIDKSVLGQSIVSRETQLKKTRLISCQKIRKLFLSYIEFE